MTARLLVGGAAAALVAAATSLLPAGELAMPLPPPAPEPVYAEADAPPLAGRTVVLDPGHQLGNRNFPSETGALVDAGGFDKACNTTGTATDTGYPEATLNLAVARLVEHRLVELGATVTLTRTRNSDDLWGPCIDERGRAGNATADLKLSIHADGSSAGHGFHVIAPEARARWTADIAGPSRHLAHVVRRELAAVLPPADYVGGGDGLVFRGDLGTLNWSDVPTVMVELGNMRAAHDARLMTSAAGRERYARALVRAVRAYFQMRT